MLVVRPSSAGVILHSRAPGAQWTGGVLRIPLPAVEVALAHALPAPGATTLQMKVIDQQYAGHSLTLRLAAQAHTQQTVTLRVNDPHLQLRAEGVGPLTKDTASLRTVLIDFGASAVNATDQYVEKTIKFSW